MKQKDRMKQNDRSTETMLVLTAGCLAIYLIFQAKAALWFCIGFGVTGLLSPYLSRRIARVWLGLGGMVGKVTNGVLLSLVYLFVVVPVALFRRFGKKERLTFFDRSVDSNYCERNHDFVKEDFEKMW